MTLTPWDYVKVAKEHYETQRVLSEKVGIPAEVPWEELSEAKRVLLISVVRNLAAGKVIQVL